MPAYGLKWTDSPHCRVTASQIDTRLTKCHYIHIHQQERTSPFLNLFTYLFETGTFMDSSSRDWPGTGPRKWGLSPDKGGCLVPLAHIAEMSPRAKQLNHHLTEPMCWGPSAAVEAVQSVFVVTPWSSSHHVCYHSYHHTYDITHTHTHPHASHCTSQSCTCETE